MFAIAIGSCGDESSCSDTALSFDGVKADEIQGDVLENGEVMGCVAGTGTHLVVGESDIHAPVQAVFHRPMRPNRLAQAPGGGRQTADVEAVLDGGLASNATLGLDDRERLQIGPLFGSGQTVELIEGKTAADFVSAMILLNGLGCCVRGTLRRCPEQSEEVTH